MTSRTLRPEDFAGLAIALALHGGLAALLVWQPSAQPLIAPPERISVTLSEDFGLTSTSPEPQAQAAPPSAPEIAPIPEPEVVPEVQPAPKIMPKARPQPVTAALPRPVPRPMLQPRAQPSPPPRTAASPRPAPPVRAQPRPATGSRISDDFLKGVSGVQATGAARNPPAAANGPQIRASLAQAVLRQVRPFWQGRVPQGVNTDRIVTVLSIELNPDGTLARPPGILSQDGIDDTNRAQARRHAEEAVRAVQLSAPFDLPADLYDVWKKLPPLRFRKSI